MIFEIALIFEILALLSVVYFIVVKRSIKALPLLAMLLVVVGSEGASEMGWVKNSLAWTNWTIVIEFLLAYVFFYLIIEFKRKWVFAFSLAYFIGWIVNSLTIQPISTTLQFYSYLIGASGLLISCLFYLHQELLLTKKSEPAYRRYFIWICSGLFIFLAAEIPIMGIINYMIENKLTVEDWSFINLKPYVSVLYYSFYLVGLIWMRTE